MAAGRNYVGSLSCLLLSARIGIVQPFTLLEFTVHLGVYDKGCLDASVVVAYTNDGYLRDAYRCLQVPVDESQGPTEA